VDVGRTQGERILSKSEREGGRKRERGREERKKDAITHTLSQEPQHPSHHWELSISWTLADFVWLCYVIHFMVEEDR